MFKMTPHRIFCIALVGACVHFAHAAEDSSIAVRQKALSNIVNVIAIPSRMIKAQLDVTSGRCLLGFDEDYAGKSEQLDRIYKEILRSPVSNDIARFNRGATIAEREAFRVEEDGCTVVEYFGSDDSFRPPVSRRTAAFALTYRDAAQSSNDKLIVSPTKGRASKDVSGSGVVEVDLKSIGEAVGPPGGIWVLKWGDKVLADWDRRQWSVITNIKSNPNLLLRIRTATAHTDLGAGERAFIPFPEGAKVTLHEKRSSGVRQLVSFSWSRQERLTLFLRTDKGASAWSREPTAFETQVVAAISAAGSGVKNEIKLSLDQRIAGRLQAGLRRGGDIIEKQVNLERRNRKLYASAAILDGINGEVLATAGLPVADPPVRLPGGAFVAPRGREEYLNRRVIGSVAKVPIGFAVVSRHPDLVSLKLRPWGAQQFNSILGQQIAPLADHGVRAPCIQKVDFTCFVAQSLNRYATTLVALAADPTLDGGSIEASGRPLLSDDFWTVKDGAEMHHVTQPKAFLFARTPAGAELAGLPWVKQAESLYDIGTIGSVGINATEASHLYAWRHALKRPGDMRALDAFSLVSPERENLQLNQARDFRGDYLSLVLGASESRWSSVKVAEVFARIVTLRRVRASFVEVPVGANEVPPLFENLSSGAQNAHGVLLDAMTRVATSEGTAGYLSKSVQRLKGLAEQSGHKLTVYMKTGTPRVDSETDSDRSEILQQLADARLLTWSRRLSERGPSWNLMYRGKLIDPSTLKGLPDEKSADFGGERRQRSLLQFLATVNRQDGADQSLYCVIRGAKIDCPDRKPTTASDDSGRNLASVFVLAKSDGSVCRVIAASFGISIRGNGRDDSAFRGIVLDGLSEDGPVSVALGFRGGPKCSA